MSVQDLAKQGYSISDYQDMFFGAIIAGVIDAQYIEQIKQEVLIGDKYKKLYNILLELYHTTGIVDYLSVYEKIAEVSGTKAETRTYLEKLTAKVPNEFNPAKAIQVLEESYFKRTALEALDAAKQTIVEKPFSAPEILFELYEKVDSITREDTIYDIRDSFQKTAEEVLSGETSKVLIPTGFKSIDDIVGGISRKEIMVVGARPGHGKTTMCVTMPLSILKRNPNIKVAVFQLEMSLDQVNRKYLASVSGVSSYRMRISQVKEEEKPKLKSGVEELAKFQDRLYIFDNIFDLYTMNKICRNVGADIAFVDFITLMDDVDEGNMRLSLGRVMKTAKRYAKMHNMSYVFFSQLNRGAEIREDHLPTTADLAESDYLSQLAAEILLLYYPFKYTLEEKDRRRLKLIFDKQRYASVADLTMDFDADLVQLKDRGAR